MKSSEKCNVDAVSRLILQHVPDAKMESNISAELSYQLPSESSQHFPQLFTVLEQQRQQLGISSFGASITTMEEVFIR